MNVLITGATGTIGSAVITYLTRLPEVRNMIAAARNIDTAKQRFAAYSSLVYRQFDFEREDTFEAAFSGIDILFLLRPPQLSKIEQFKPVLLAAQKKGIQKIVFLSVQGADKSAVIPHSKIEKLIKEMGFKYIFVRPSYFMQNLTNALLQEIVEDRQISLPAGKAVFNWVDVDNIGEAISVLIQQFGRYQNQAFDITGTENENFAAVAAMISAEIGEEVRYKSMNPFCFYWKKRREGLASGFAMVMTILHFLPRLQVAPTISNTYYRLAGKSPTLLEEFVERERETFINGAK